MKKISIKNVMITSLTGIMVSLLFFGHPSEAKRSGYDVYYNKKNILSVNMVESGAPVGNGYYQVEFEIPKTGKKAFITGLTAENVQQTQDSLIESYTDGDDFSIYNLDYIDTEKTAVTGVDSELCWAGQAADMLTYAGWTKKAGFKNEDDVLDMFSEVFADEGGVCRYGFSWFMNGYAGDQTTKSDKEGGFLRDYPYDMLYESDGAVYYDGTDGNKPYKFFRKMMNALRKGDAIGLDVDWVGDPDSSGAHAITLFGYIYNTSVKDTSLKHYDSMIIADSDSDKGGINDRRDASNSLNIVNAKPYKGDFYESLILERYGNGVITTMERLTPYSEGLAKETDSRATKNLKNTPDLRVSNVVASTSERPYASDVPYLAAGQDVHIRLNVQNNGAVGYDAPYTIHATLADKDGKVLQTVDSTGHLKVSNFVEMVDTDAVFSALPEGEYTIEGRIEPGSGAKEAYLINNSFSRKITVKKTTIDPSAVSVSVSVPDFRDGLTSQAKITYSDPAYILDNGLQNAIAVSYLSDGKWSPYTEIYSTTDIASDSYGNRNYSTKDLTNYKNGLLKTLDVGKEGTAVSVRLSLFSEDSAPIYYYSEPCELKYLSLKVNGPEDEVYFGPIPNGANKLNNSENIEFTIENNSTYDGGKVSGNYYIYLESWEDSSLLYDLTEKKNITLGYKEKSDPIRINSWSKGIPVAGKYYVYMCFHNTVSDSDENVSLGVLSVKEKPSTKVTTLEDVTDPLDGGISLREAVSYAGSGIAESKKITFEKYAKDETIMLTKPIDVEGDVEINGIYKSHGYAYGHKLYNSNGGLFDVKKGASLSINGLILSNNITKTGGAIYADNADVTVSNCRFSNLMAEDAGGAIYAKKSKVLVKNSTFETCTSSKGGVIYVTDGTVCQILNSIFNGNSGVTDSLIENDNSTLHIVSSSLVDNASYNNGSVFIKSNASTGILGSILCENTYDQIISGPVHFYGSAIFERSELAADAVLDTLTKKVESKEDLYDTSMDYVSVREKSDPKAASSSYEFVLFKELCSKEYEGVIIQATDSGLVYGAGEGEKLESKIPVLFAKEDYSKDMYGDVRGAVYGSDATPYVEPAVGHSPITINNKQVKKKNAETYIGRAVCDAAKLSTNADIVLITTAAISSGIKKGDVTAPMLNRLIGEEVIILRKKIKGKDIKKILETSIDYMLKDKTKYASKTLQLGGVTVSYSESGKKGNRIKQIKIGGKKIDYKKTYKVAMDLTTANFKPYSGYGKNDYKVADTYWYDTLEKYFNKSFSYIKKSIKKARYIKK